MEPRQTTPQSKKSLWPNVVIALCGLAVGLTATIGVLQLTAKLGSMTTSNNQSSGPALATPASLSDGYDIFAAKGVKEFTADNKAAVLAAYSELAKDFSIGSAFTNDTTNQLHALGLAYLYSKYPQKKTLYQNELYLLAMPYLDKLPAGINDSTFEPVTEAEANAIDVLTSYRDEGLSKRVESSAQFATTLETVVKNLKLGDKSKLSTYKIVAYNFDSDSQQFAELTKKHDMYGAKPMMWVEQLKGTNYIMMMKGYAEDVIAGNKNSLLHEFIHAQSAFVRGEAGRMIEERRAEYFSGDTSAYYETKQLAIYLEVLGDVSMLSLFDAHPTDVSAFFIALYTKLGVVGTQAVIFSWPTAFQGGASEAIQLVSKENNANTALDAALGLGQKDKAGLEKRLQARYDKLLGSLSTNAKVAKHVVVDLTDMYNLPTATSTMKDFMQRHGYSTSFTD